jgi:K+-sensing histidine kinase KdpD
VLVNLLSNASKYGPDETEVELAVGVETDLARISVADRGPGIPPEYRADLFRRFIYPAQDSNKAQYGLGLGLSVVKAIVEAQGGQVGVEDRLGGGSIFWFTLTVEHAA